MLNKIYIVWSLKNSLNLTVVSVWVKIPHRVMKSTRPRQRAIYTYAIRYSL